MKLHERFHVFSINKQHCKHKELCFFRKVLNTYGHFDEKQSIGFCFCLVENTSIQLPQAGLLVVQPGAQAVQAAVPREARSEGQGCGDELASHLGLVLDLAHVGSPPASGAGYSLNPFLYHTANDVEVCILADVWPRYPRAVYLPAYTSVLVPWCAYEFRVLLRRKR